MKRYLVIEQGQYSDYGVSLVEIPEGCPITDEDVASLLKIDQYDQPTISGEIKGEIELYDNASIDIKNIIEEAKSNINGLFACYDNREFKTVLDKEYTKEELLKMATTNDRSGQDYWEKQINTQYSQYLEGYKLYKKLIESV